MEKILKPFTNLHSATTGESFNTLLSPCHMFFIDQCHMVKGILTDKYRLFPLQKYKNKTGINFPKIFDTSKQAEYFYYKNIYKK